MLVSCWSAKGGVGVTTVAAGLALSCPGADAAPTLLADLAGDQPLALGIDAPTGPGLADWLSAGPEVPVDALRRLVVPVRPGLGLLPRGSGRLDPGRAPLLVQVLASWMGTVVVDAGRPDLDPVAAAVARDADRSVLVARRCPLALARAVDSGIRPSGVVLVSEPGRALGPSDVGRVVGAGVLADVALDAAVARAVDVGLVRSRLPRGFRRALVAVVAS